VIAYTNHAGNTFVALRLQQPGKKDLQEPVADMSGISGTRGAEPELSVTDTPV